MNSDIRKLLVALSQGNATVDEVLLQLKSAPFDDIDFAKIDTHRAIRQGVPEVVYGPGKTKEQLDGILSAMEKAGQRIVLVTRIESEIAAYLTARHPMRYDPDSRLGVVGEFPEPDGLGTVLVVTAGTSDIPVAEEAAVTLQALGNRVTRIYDLGVSTPQALMHYLPDILTASVIIAIAGMEGALACILAGYADCPVIAVPTSVGYGASFGGLAALLSMLTSCSNGVSVVNIDNGFGAGYQASMINHMCLKD
ncbi:MAG: nickel pincer cofactor biosynthesis protein LarB [Clostridia bacterium]|nr:nickel pincer cofactor biosynthesis protein LarB [Clostridia bacterium]